MTVEFNLHEFNVAVQIAMTRMICSGVMRLNHASTYARSHLKRLEEEVIGVLGEMTVAKKLGVYHLPSINQFHRLPDCIGNTEVRASLRPDACLIVRDNDADDRLFVLVVADGNAMRIAGCVLGKEAKQDRWMRNPHNHRVSWFVPQSALGPFDLRLT